MKTITVICAECGESFTKPWAWAKRTKRHFCSVPCHNGYQIRTRSSWNRCRVCRKLFLVSPSQARRYTTCSSGDCRSFVKRGPMNGNWKGGVTSPRKRDMSTARYRRWRAQVFARDDFTCVFCGKRGGHMNADHIRPWAYFPSLRYEVSNGRTLCLDCHKTTYKEVFKWRAA